MQADQATRILDEVGSIRRGTRELLRAWWFPPFLFGLAMLVMVPVGFLPGGTLPLVVLDLYWVVAGGIAAWAIWLRGRRLEARHGVGGHLREEFLSAVVLLAVAFLAARGVWAPSSEHLFGWDLPYAVGWPVVDFVYFAPWYPPLTLAVGYSLLALWERRAGLAVAGFVAALGLVVLGAIAYTGAHTLGSVETSPFISFYSVRSPRAVVVTSYAVAFLGMAAVFRYLLVRPR